MKPRICLSIGNTGLNGVYEAIDYAKSKSAELVELRFDMITETAMLKNQNIDSDKSSALTEIKKIISYAKDKKIKIIGTNRDPSYGFNRCVSFLERQVVSESETSEKNLKCGVKETSEPERIKFLRSVMELGIDICDIELDTLKKADIKNLIGFAHSKNSQVILSVHDFNGRIDMLDTVKYYIDSSYFGADYFKITDTAVSEEDAALIVEKNIKIGSIKMSAEEVFPKFIIFGMGEKGKIARALSVINGSYFAYCSSPYGITAAGQTLPEDFYKTVSLLEAS